MKLSAPLVSSVFSRRLPQCLELLVLFLPVRLFRCSKETRKARRVGGHPKKRTAIEPVLRRSDERAKDPLTTIVIYTPRSEIGNSALGVISFLFKKLFQNSMSPF